MQNSKKGFANKVLAWVISLAMILPMFPASALAGSGEKKAGGAIESSVSNDAKNAIHAYVGIQVGGDLNMKLEGDALNQQFKPIAGVRAYFQWFENGGYASPVYTAVSDAQGRLNIGCKPFLASDGKIIKFDADTTVSGGTEKYRFWIDYKNLPDSLKDYQFQYITGENVVFPSDEIWVSQGGATTDVVPNTISDMKILFMEKPKAFMHKANPTETPAIRTSIGNGGTVWGKVTWDYESPSGGTQWGIVATPSSPAPGVKIKASYLSDYALKQIYSQDTVARMGLSSPDDIRGSKWSYALETQLQEWIQEQVKKDPDKWIAETVTTRPEGTNAKGEYKIQFNGTWGPARNKDVYKYKAPNLWPQAKKDRIGTVATSPNDGSFDAVIGQDTKHINIDWMFISADDTEDLRLMTPFNNNWFTGTSGLTGNWGIHSGWAQDAFGVTTALDTKNNIRADFGFGSPGVNFDITNYDSGANTAIPGDIAKTKTTGLPYKFSTDKFQIVWYGPDGNEVPNSRGAAQQPSSTGTIDAAPLDTSKLNITKTTEYTAKLYRVKPDGTLDAQPIAADSFTVEVSHLFVSRYDDVNIVNPKASDKEMKGATYSATGLPDALTMEANTGTIKGKAKTAGLYKAAFKTILPDKSGNIEGTRDRYIAVTDSPLAAGEVGKAYSQDVKPEPAKDPKGKDYIYKMKSVSFISSKEIEGLSVTGDATNGFKITGTPTKEANATEDVLNNNPGPNVEVTYDIYKTNDQGKEVLVKANHKDLVPLVIEKAKDSSLYEPDYKAVDGKVGTKATVAAPKFLDEKSKETPKPVATTQPTGMKFALGTGAPEGAEVLADGSVTYTPKAGEEGQKINVPVVVTYDDKSTDNATATINVAALPDVIDQTADPSKPTPDGYFRVTIDKGEGTKFADGQTKKVYDVKSGKSLTDAQYPTLEIADANNYKKPITWTVAPGTAIDKAVDIVGNATKTDANTHTPAGKAITTDLNTVPEAKTGIENVADMPDGTTYTWKENPDVSKVTEAGKPVKATVVVTYPDKTTDEVPVEITVVDNRPDVIDQTADPSKPTPDGYFRVTIDKGEGTKFADGQTKKVYDVKSGKSLTDAQYPTLEIADANNYKKPITWTVAPGTAIDKAVDIVGNATKTDANTHTPAGKAITTDLNTVPEAKTGIENVADMPDGTTYTWKTNPDVSKVTEAGKPVKATVVVTYKDGTKDEVEVEITVVDNRPDVIDQTADPSKPTPDGYFRVTVDAGEGTKLAQGQTKKVYDVKSGKSLAEGQYPTLEISDANNYKKPITWTVAPGTAITKAADIIGNAAKTQAGENTPTAKAITTDLNTVPEAKTGIENATDMPEGTTYTWKTNPDVSKVTEAGKPVKATVVVTYKDGTKDEVEVEITVVDNRPDVIDQTADPSKPTPDGYFRVTVDAGEGTKLAQGQTKKVYDVKSGKSLTDAQYPTLEISDANSYKKPITWTVAPGTAITKAADIVGNAAKTQAGENTPTAKAITTDLNTVPEAKTGIENATDMPEGTTYTWKTNPDVSKVTEAGKPVKATVVVTYKDGTKDEVEVEITVVDNRPDVIDQTADPSKPTPDGYFRVTVDAGEGTKLAQGQTKKVYDVKSGKSLTDAQYPTLEISDANSYKKPITWTVAPGTAITKAADIVGNATKTDANNNTPTAQVITVEKNGTPEAKDGISNKDTLPDGTTYSWKNNETPDTGTTGDKTGTVVVTYPDGSKDEVEVTVKVTEKATPVEKDADKYDPKVTPITKENGVATTEDEVKGAVTVPDYPTGGKQPTVSVDDASKLPDGKTAGTFDLPVTITYPDGSKDHATVQVKVKEKTGTQASEITPIIPSKTPVDDKTKLTNEEKDKVKKAVEDANKDNFPKPEQEQDKTKVEVGDDGSATITYPDGSQEVIPGSDLVREKTKVDGQPKPVDPTDKKQGTGVVVTNPDDGTKVTAKDEDGNKVPVKINPNTGEIEVTPGTKVDGPITVTVTDPDLQNGKEVITVPVKGHEKGVDDNNSDNNGGNNNVVPPQKPTVEERIGGKDRIDTAIEISKKYYSYADNVIIARSDDFPDALTASVLAKALNAPILLTNPGALDSRVKAEIERLGAKNVYIIGKENAISMNTKGQLKALGKVERIGGSDRYETSAMVARKVVSLVGNKGIAVIATGENFADALSMSPFAAKNGYPILLVSHNKVTGVIEKAIKDLGIKSVYIAGREMAVSYKVQKALPKLIERVGGTDRYETSAKIADMFFTNAKEAFMASGQVFADALVIGPVAAMKNVPVLLTQKNSLPKAIKAVIDRCHFEKITIVGLQNAVSKEVIEAINK